MSNLRQKIKQIPHQALIELNNVLQYAHQDCNEIQDLLVDLLGEYMQDYLICKKNNRFLDQYNEQVLDQMIQKYQLV